MFKYLSVMVIMLSTNMVGSGAPSTALSDSVIKIASDLELVRINENAWICISSLKDAKWGIVKCNGLIYINENKAYMIDTPPDNNTTKLLIDFIQNEMKAEIQGVIVNHWHSDCMGGLDEVHRRGIKSYANKLTCSITQSKKLPVPKCCFEESLTLKLGRKDIICRYLGQAHSKDNIVTWIPEEKILFVGCMVKDLKSTSLGNISDANMITWSGTLQKVQNEFSNAKIIIPGHGAYGGMELINHTQYLILEAKQKPVQRK